ncbi:hypothetical protein SCE1572_06520 [Sorangium cellulosum So0157-2]|uniref:Uncharacterized protein n=1 Tax=Sorangium cellulosum So0157-2 TaxID=1254432 RepID=S4XNN6_SORCE|nr:hypothetical protein SCE1572_06520 [Sorangium cellulosum So0157-2]
MFGTGAVRATGRIFSARESRIKGRMAGMDLRRHASEGACGRGNARAAKFPPA